MIAMNAPTRGLPARALLIVMSSGLAAAACGRIPGQFIIVNNQVPQIGCVIPTNDAVYRGQGEVDLQIVNQADQSAYLVFPLLENELPGSSGGIDPNLITLTGFNVDISGIGPVPAQTATILGDPGNRSITHYQVPWSGSVPSGGGKVSAAVNGLPVALALLILGTQEIGLNPSVTLDLRVSALGHTPTQSFESDPLDYPVSLCVGCLVANLQSCPFTAMLKNPGNPCNPAQDDIVDCCLTGANLLCPGPVVSK
jgi:hypothetical protein